jgi:predicted RND superfamily exporter protein
MDDLPQEIMARWVTEGGVARLEIYPKKRIEEDNEALHRFVDEVRTVAPEAIGEPVILVETARTVIWAFAEAAIIAVVAIAVLLGVLIRNARDVALIFAPLILAALLTVAVTVVIDMPFNLANVIALPLLFGLGVAGSLQLVMRERTEGQSAGALNSSTPRAVLFSALTTIGSFGTLAISNHLGIANMGLLLAIAISLSLLCTLVVTPALMAVYGRTNR